MTEHETEGDDVTEKDEVETENQRADRHEKERLEAGERYERERLESHERHEQQRKEEQEERERDKGAGQA